LGVEELQRLSELKGAFRTLVLICIDYIDSVITAVQKLRKEQTIISLHELASKLHSTCSFASEYLPLDIFEKGIITYARSEIERLRNDIGGYEGYTKIPMDATASLIIRELLLCTVTIMLLLQRFLDISFKMIPELEKKIAQTKDEIRSLLKSLEESKEGYII